MESSLGMKLIKRFSWTCTQPSICFNSESKAERTDEIEKFVSQKSNVDKLIHCSLLNNGNTSRAFPNTIQQRQIHQNPSLALFYQTFALSLSRSFSTMLIVLNVAENQLTENQSNADLAAKFPPMGENSWKMQRSDF